MNINEPINFCIPPPPGTAKHLPTPPSIIIQTYTSSISLLQSHPVHWVHLSTFSRTLIFLIVIYHTLHASSQSFYRMTYDYLHTTCVQQTDRDDNACKFRILRNAAYNTFSGTYIDAAAPAGSNNNKLHTWSWCISYWLSFVLSMDVFTLCHPLCFHIVIYTVFPWIVPAGAINFSVYQEYSGCGYETRAGTIQGRTLLISLARICNLHVTEHCTVFH